MTDQEQFEEIFTTYITRQGSAELLEWMKKTDFFTSILADFDSLGVRLTRVR